MRKRTVRLRASAWALILLVGACQSKPEQTDALPAPDPVGALAERATLFEGTLPCADCAGIRYQLLLRPDSVYFLRRSYLAAAVFNHDDIGRWHMDEARRLVRLRGGRDEGESFRLVHSDTLRLLDTGEADIASDLNYSLVRREESALFEPTLPMRGMFSYMADAPLFRECSSELRLPVAMEAEYPLLERGYLESASEPGSLLLAEIVGKISSRPATDREGYEDVLVVERFAGVWPGESCGAQGAEASLENTFWGLVRMGSSQVRLAPDQREVHIRFLPDRNVVQGFAGCNTFSGSFKWKEDRLTFGTLGSSRMACPYLDMETTFFSELARVSHFRIAGDHLELMDASGQALLRFEARYFR